MNNYFYDLLSKDLKNHTDIANAIKQDFSRYQDLLLGIGEYDADYDRCKTLSIQSGNTHIFINFNEDSDIIIESYSDYIEDSVPKHKRLSIRISKKNNKIDFTFDSEDISNPASRIQEKRIYVYDPVSGDYIANYVKLSSLDSECFFETHVYYKEDNLHEVKVYNLSETGGPVKTL